MGRVQGEKGGGSESRGETRQESRGQEARGEKGRGARGAEAGSGGDFLASGKLMR
jgi:hypothetical protein